MLEDQAPVEGLIEVVRRLRAEGGCDWDRAQTPETLRSYLLEEAHELVDAIGRGAVDEVRGELGDVLFLVTMIARMHEEAGEFSLEDVAASIRDKMIHRHPHVFGDGVKRSWAELKAEERLVTHGDEPDGPSSAIAGLPASLPPLLRAHRMTERAAGVGFDWPTIDGVRAKVDEELAELDEAIAQGDPDAITDELGDVVFTLVNLGRFLPVPTHHALERATAKFERRFRAVERACLAAGATVHSTDLDTLESHWRSAKEIT